MNWLKSIIHKISNYDKVVAENNGLRNKNEGLKIQNKLLIEQIGIAYEEIEEIKDELETATDEKLTELDEYCISKGYKLKKVAYQNKREINDKPITVFLHELIQPESYEVYNLARKIKTYTPKGVGNYVARNFTWKSDTQFNPETKDYYLQPNELIVNKTGDCEDHSYLMASLMPETMGVAYGFVNLPDGRSFGHAFNVYINSNKLFLLDTVENSVIIKDVEKHYYTINYIVTRKGTYVVDDSIKFGLEAR